MPAVLVTDTDTVTLTWTVVDWDGKLGRPHQHFLRFYDEETGQEGIQPVRVGPSGKVKYELVRISRPFVEGAR